MKKISLVFIICSMIFLTGCSSEDKEASNVSSGVNSSSSGVNSNSSGVVNDDLEKKVVTSGAVSADGRLVVFVKNNNSVAVDMEFEVEFYDASGLIVGSDEDYLNAVGVNTEVAIEMTSTPESFDNYKIYVDVKESKYINYFDQIELSHNNNGEEILVQVKNSSDDIIEEISVSVVYYQGDRVVGIDEGYEYDISSGRSANFTLYYPTDKRYNDVSFDNYKVFVNEANTYNW